MRMNISALAAGLACLAGTTLAGAGAAEARVVEGVTGGVLWHSVPVSDIKNSGKETGADFQFEVNFARPSFLEWSKIHPYVIVSLNTNGDASYAGFGWNWDFRYGDQGQWGFQPILGYVIHNGDTQDPYPKGHPLYGEYFNTHLLLGSRAVSGACVISVSRSDIVRTF